MLYFLIIKKFTIILNKVVNEQFIKTSNNHGLEKSIFTNMIVYTCGWLLHGLEALALNKYNRSASLRGPPNP